MYRVWDVVDVDVKVLIVLLEKHWVPAKAYNSANDLRLKLSVVWTSMQLDQANVDGRRNFETSYAHTVIEHFVGRLGIRRKLITSERFQVPENLQFHKCGHVSETAFAHLFKDQALHHVSHVPFSEKRLKPVDHYPVFLIHPHALSWVQRWFWKSFFLDLCQDSLSALHSIHSLLCLFKEALI